MTGRGARGGAADASPAFYPTHFLLFRGRHPLYLLSHAPGLPARVGCRPDPRSDSRHGVGTNRRAGFRRTAGCRDPARGEHRRPALQPVAGGAEGAGRPHHGHHHNHVRTPGQHRPARHRLRDQPGPRAVGFRQRRFDSLRVRQRPHRSPDDGPRGGLQHDRDRLHRRQRSVEPQRGVPVCAVRAGTSAAGDSGLRSAGPEGAVDAQARLSGRLAGGQQRGGRSPHDRDRADIHRPVRRPSPCRPTSSPSSSATSRSSRPSATAAPSACSTAKPTRRR